MKRIGKDKSSRVVAHKVKGMIDRRRNDGGHSQLRPPTVVCTSVEKEREKKRERERERESMRVYLLAFTGLGFSCEVCQC